MIDTKQSSEEKRHLQSVALQELTDNFRLRLDDAAVRSGILSSKMLCDLDGKELCALKRNYLKRFRRKAGLPTVDKLIEATKSVEGQEELRTSCKD